MPLTFETEGLYDKRVDLLGAKSLWNNKPV